MIQSLVTLLLVCLGFAGDERMQSEYDEALRLLAADQFAEAIPLLESLQRRVPDEPAVRQALGISLLRRGQHHRVTGHLSLALSDLQRGQKLAPSEAVHFAVEEARVRFERHEWETARILLQTAARARPSAPIEEMLGCLDYLQDSMEGALRHLEHAVLLDPDNPRLAALRDRFARELRHEAAFVTRSGSRFRMRLDPRGPGVRHEAALLRILEGVYSEICQVVGGRPRDAVIVVLYPEAEFSAATQAHPWVRGLYDGKIRIPVPAGDLDEAHYQVLLRHEFTHCVLHQLWPDAPGWVHEGLAQALEGDRRNAHDGLRSLLSAEQPLVSPAELPVTFSAYRTADEARVGYAVSHSFVDFLRDDFPPRCLKDFLESGARGMALEPAFRRAFAISWDEAVSRWRRVLEAPASR